MKFIYSAVLALLWLLLFSCSAANPCVSMGENLFGNLEKIKEMVSRYQLPTTEEEAAFIIGAAKAVSQIERTPVEVCLRLANLGITEFRVVSRSGNVLEEWRVADPASP